MTGGTNRGGRPGDYLLAIKDNRPALHSEVSAFFDAAHSHGLEPLVTTDKGHVRIEIRRHYVSHDLDWLSGPKAAGGLPELPPELGYPAMVETRGRGHAQRQDQRHPALLPRVRKAERRTLRRGRTRPLADRKQPTLGARRDLRRGRGPQPHR